MSDIDTIIDQYLQYLDGEAPEPTLDDLTPEERAEAHAQIRVLVALHRTGVPDPDDDPVARRFGFDRAGADIVIDGRRMARRRQERGLKLNELAAAVNRAGGTITTSALLRLEQQPHGAVPQATVTAIVAVLDTSLQDLEPADASADEAVERLRTLLASPRLEAKVAAWCAEHQRSQRDVGRHLEQRLLVGAAYRAEDLTEDALLEIVRAILAGLDP